jgi:subtilase family serine protease
MILKFLRNIVPVFALVPVLSGYAQVATTPVAPQITQKIDASVRHALSNSVPVQIRSATDTGRVSSNLPMKDMLLRLQPSAAQKAALKQFMDDVQNPNSANYHRWLTPAEFGVKFGVADQDVQTVTNWLTSNGFEVNEVARGKGWIRFSGTSSQVETAFATEIHSYKAAGVERYANATSLSIPAALAPAVAGVVSMNSFTKAPLHTRLGSVVRARNGKMVRTGTETTPGEVGPVDPLNQALLANPNFTSQSAPEQTFLAPGDFAAIYNTTPLVSGGNDGTGVSIAIVGRSDISLSDVEAFRTVFGLPFNDPTLIHANDDPGVVPGDDEEAILDLEWSGAVAPKASVNYVIGASTYSTDGVDISAAYIVDNLVAPIMSVSFGECEQAVSQDEMDFYSDLWQQAAAEGISVFVSSGDAGSSMCDVPNEYFATSYGMGVNALASTPYNTAVGGTEFADTSVNTYWNTTVSADLSSAKGYIPEAVWNESCNANVAVSADNCYFDPTDESTYAGGGGASNCAVHPPGDTPNLLSGLYDCTSGYAKPTWQAGTGVPADGARDVPDVALAAAALHDGFMICYDGSCQWTTNSDGSITLESASIIGGTSAASPSMAGIMALVEQKNGTLQGLANYQLYKLAAQQGATSACNSSTETDPTQSSACVFHDITAGSNALSCIFGRTDCTVAISGSRYGVLTGNNATTGYDLASGLGSVDAGNLVKAWSTVTTAPTSTTLSVSSKSFVHGTPINVQAVVSPTSGSGTPSGLINLKAAGTGVETGPIVATSLTGGKYAAALTSLPGGTYNLTAYYAGDANYSSSTSTPIALTVNPEGSVLTAATFAPSRFFILGHQPIVPATAVGLGTNFLVQVQVAGNSGAGVATGSVSFAANGKTYGPYPLDHTGSIYVPCGPGTDCDIPLGSYTFTATYSGDGSFSASTTTFPFTINQGKLNYSSGLSSQTPPVNTTVIASVYFNYDPVAVPTGKVILTRDDTGAVLATGSIGSNGIATIPFTALAGTYDVIPTWAGDSNYAPGIVTEYEQLIPTVSGAVTTTTAMTVSSKSATVGGSTQFVVAVKPAKIVAGTSGPSGTVTIHTSTGLQAAPVTVVGGQVSTFLSWSTAGPVSVYATYDGDNNYGGSATGLTTINVGQATPTVQLQSLAGYVATGAQTSVTASIVSALANSSAAAPTGTIQFYDSIGGAAAIPIGTPQPLNTGNGNTLVATLAPVLAAGVNTVTAKYSGDANWTAATSSPVVIQVTTPDFSDSATPNPVTVTAGQTAAISIQTQSILGFNSAISLSCETLPAGMSCNSATLQPGNSGTISLTTTAPGTVNATATASLGSRMAIGVTGTVSLAGLFLLVSPRRRRRMSMLTVLVVIGFGAAMTGTLIGCGGSSAKATNLVVTSANSKVASGSPMSFEATITSANNPTGTVTFYDGGTEIGTPSAVDSSVAVLNISTLAVGTHAITAKYSGDSNNLASQSGDVLNQTVTGSFTLVINATAGTVSHPITVPATLQ